MRDTDGERCCVPMNWLNVKPHHWDGNGNFCLSSLLAVSRSLYRLQPRYRLPSVLYTPYAMMMLTCSTLWCPLTHLTAPLVKPTFVVSHFGDTQVIPHRHWRLFAIFIFVYFFSCLSFYGQLTPRLDVVTFCWYKYLMMPSFVCLLVPFFLTACSWPAHRHQHHHSTKLPRSTAHSVCLTRLDPTLTLGYICSSLVLSHCLACQRSG